MARFKTSARALVGMVWMASSATQATDCDIQRGYVGAEAILTNGPDSLWQNEQQAFRNNRSVNGYTSANARCRLGSNLTLHSQIGGEYAVLDRQPGTLEDSNKAQGLVLINSLAATKTAQDSLLIDIGKIRKANGNLFSIAPLDLQRNVSGAMRSVKVNALGDRWRNFYDEGAWGAGATLYLDNGAVDMTILPRLTHNDKRQESASDWSTLARTNSTDRYYASYTSTGLQALNPTVSLLAGDQKTLALGGSGNLTDSVILSVEGSISQGQTWRHLDMRAAKNIRAYQYEPRPFNAHANGVSGDLGVGLRYATQEQIEYGAEYYTQSQGYSRSEWRDYFNTVGFVNGGYQRGIPPELIIPGIQQSYRQYSHMMAAETDNVSRAGKLLGKHYLTLYTRSNKNTPLSLDWSASGITNLIDQSGMINLHLTLPLTDCVESYTGTSLTFGDNTSEFGSFGDRSIGYAGMRILW